jgi:hypothetical protein
MSEGMNPPPLDLKQLEELKELKRRLGVHLKFETDDSGLWNDYVYAYAIKFYVLFHSHYASFPDFVERSEDAARQNAVATTIDVIGQQLYNFRSLQPSYERKVFERLGEHIKREEAKRKPLALHPFLGVSNQLGLSPQALGISAPQLLPINVESIRRRAFVDPLLAQKGWNVAVWAKEAKVSRHTAIDYLDGKRKTYHSSLRSLAKALGVSFQDFPR